MTIRNRELSQFGSFIYIDNTTKDIGITTEATPYVGIGTTNSQEKFHVVGQSRIDGSLNVSGIITAVSFDGQLDGNAATATTAINADNINVSSTSSTDTTTYPLLVGNSSTGNQSSFIDSSGLSYNASTNTLTSDNFSGNGSLVTNLNASNITSGTIDDAYLPSTISSDIIGNAATATTATSLQTARNFSITGDFVTASSVSFDGKSDVSIAATLTEDSVILGTYTSGDYVGSISGTSNEIIVTGGSGEGSTPSIGLSSDLEFPGNLYVTGLSTFTGVTTFTNDLYTEDVFSNSVNASSFYLNGSLLVEASTQIWEQASGSDVYRKLGNVGIGTSTNLYKLSVNGQIESQASHGTAPFVVRSTTNVPNLNASFLNGKTAPTGDIVGTTATQTLTSKTINLTNNTLSGTLSQFNTALSDANFVSTTGTETLTNKTLTTPIISSISNSGIQTVPTGNGTLISTNSVGLITRTMIGDLDLVDSDISNSAEIKFSKISTVGVGNSIENDDIANSTIQNAKLVNSTISGISLGSNLNALSPGTYLSGNPYDGSTARTWNISATSANTADTLVSRDSNGDFSAGTISATSFIGDGSQLTGITADASIKVATASTGTSATFYPTFVDSNNTPGEYENVFTDAEITYNPSSNTLTVGTISATTIGIGANTVIDNTRKFIPVTIEAGGTVGSAGSILSSTGSGLEWISLGILSPGTHLSGDAYDGSTSVTWNVTSSSTNTANTLVSRDSNGNFSAGTINVENFNSTGNGIIDGNLGIGTTLARHTLDVIGGFSFSGEAIESVKITAGTLLANQNINLTDGMVHYFTSNEVGVSTANIRIDGSTSLNSKMNVGTTVAVTIIIKPNNVGYSTCINIDGSYNDVKWIGGSDPTTGSSSGVDIYTYQIIKTATSTFEVLGAVNNFA